MSVKLPARPSLVQLKKQAKELLKAYRKGSRIAANRLSMLPRFARQSIEKGSRITLQEAQHVLAMEYGAANWDDLMKLIKKPEPKYVLPKWEPRASREKIWQIYHNDAIGNRDEDLVDDVGWTILMRIRSCLIVSEAQKGRVECPQCNNIVQREMRPKLKGADEIVHCKECGWEVPWAAYRKTFHNKHLGCAGMLVPCQEFADKYPAAKTYYEKLILIDTLIHRFHWEMEKHPGQPGATVIIGGTMSEIGAFLERLTYGDQTTPELKETRNRFMEIGKDKYYGPPSAKAEYEASKKEKRVPEA